MRKLLLLLSLLLIVPAHAQLFFPPSPIPTAATCVAVGYSGPGDVVASAVAWSGLRAYSAAKCGNKAIQIESVVTLTTKDINTLQTGDLDISTAEGFGGTDAVCSGTISGTTLSVTSCSPSTFHVGDQVTGAGINQPAAISAVGTCASPPGTCTLNLSQTVGSSETITISIGLAITKLYDQTGNTNCSSAACDYAATGVNPANVPFLMANCLNTTKPCGVFFSHNTGSPVTANSMTSLAQPFTISDVSNRLVASSYNMITGWGGSGVGVGYINGAAQRWLNFSAAPTAAASTGSLHAVQNVINNTSSYITVDSATPTTVSVGTTGDPINNVIYWGQSGTGNQLVNGILVEIGIWGSAFSTTLQGNMYSNQHTYWGTL